MLATSLQLQPDMLHTINKVPMLLITLSAFNRQINVDDTSKKCLVINSFLNLIIWLDKLSRGIHLSCLRSAHSGKAFVAQCISETTSLVRWYYPHNMYRIHSVDSGLIIITVVLIILFNCEACLSAASTLLAISTALVKVSSFLHTLVLDATDKIIFIGKLTPKTY